MTNVVPLKPRGKPVIVTALTIEFHENGGWTIDILNQYIKKGAFIKRGVSNSRYDSVHWIPELGSDIDYDKMVADGQVGRMLDKHLYADTYNRSALDILKMRG